MTIGERSRVWSEAWRNLSDAEKIPYQEESKRLKEEQERADFLAGYGAGGEDRGDAAGGGGGRGKAAITGGKRGRGGRGALTKTKRRKKADESFAEESFTEDVPYTAQGPSSTAAFRALAPTSPFPASSSFSSPLPSKASSAFSALAPAVSPASSFTSSSCSSPGMSASAAGSSLFSASLLEQKKLTLHKISLLNRKLREEHEALAKIEMQMKEQQQQPPQQQPQIPEEPVHPQQQGKSATTPPVKTEPGDVEEGLGQSLGNALEDDDYDDDDDDDEDSDEENVRFD